MRAAVLIAMVVVFISPVYAGGGIGSDEAESPRGNTGAPVLIVSPNPCQAVSFRIPGSEALNPAADEFEEENAPQISVSVREKLIAVKKICWLPYKQALYASISPAIGGSTLPGASRG